MIAHFQRLVGIVLRLAGIDAAVSNVLLGRVWSLISGPISMLLIATTMKPAEQGFYYTFFSVLALKFFAEMGLQYVVMQFASHEVAECHLLNGQLFGPARNLSRLKDLYVKSMAWYIWVSVFIVCSILPAGFWFFLHNNSDGEVHWKGAWIALVIAAAMSVLFIPATAIVEGCGAVAEVAKNRMLQGVASGVFLWIPLCLGAGLYSTAISVFASISVVGIWLYTTKRKFISKILEANSEFQIGWKREVLPMQWRTAVSWISGYFAYMLFTPMVFATYGADLAGKMGMSLRATEIIGFTAGAWLQTKSPIFGRLVAARQWKLLNDSYLSAMRQSIVVFALGAFAFMASLLFLEHYNAEIYQRFLHARELYIMLGISFLNHIIFSRALFMRAFKVEPFYWVFLLNGLITAGILIVVLPAFGLFITLCTVVVTTNLPAIFITGHAIRHIKYSSL